MLNSPGYKYSNFRVRKNQTIDQTFPDSCQETAVGYIISKSESLSVMSDSENPRTIYI